MAGPGTHERIERHEHVKPPSERSFGWTFAVVFSLLAAFSFWHRGVTPTLYVTLAVSAAFAAVTLVAPRVLKPLNVAWLKFGLVLHKVVNPVIMGLLFYGVFTPIGVVMRAFGADLLRMTRKTSSGGYWVVKAEEGLADSSMKDQF
jgi:formate-dependent nitrite reductase membrane component NrfD